jgi:hypothetical protein
MYILDMLFIRTLCSDVSKGWNSYFIRCLICY